LLRTSAVLIWAVAAGFGAPAIPCAHQLLRHGRLPSFFGLFRMYEGPAFARVSAGTYVVLLYAFTLLCVAEAIAGGLLWNGLRAGAVLSFALLPVEIAFWWAFALPIPPMFAAVRLTLTVLAWHRGALS
jgi:hypothetical protein